MLGAKRSFVPVLCVDPEPLEDKWVVPVERLAVVAFLARLCRDARRASGWVIFQRRRRTC